MIKNATSILTYFDRLKGYNKITIYQITLLDDTKDIDYLVSILSV